MKTRFHGLLRPGHLLVVSVALVFAGCASSGGGAKTPAADPPASVKKAFVPPEWASESFESGDHGFSVHYPADFAESPAQGGGLFSAASPSQVPRIDLTILPMPPSTPMEAVGNSLAEAMAQLGGGESKVTASRAVKLKDEVTDAMEFTLEWTFQGFPLQSLVLGASSVNGSEIVSVMVTGMQGGDVAELAEIAYTLYIE